MAKEDETPRANLAEFEPAGPGFEAANEKLAALGVDPDGYGWATLIQRVAEKYHPEMAKELQLGIRRKAPVWFGLSQKTCVVSLFR